MKYRLIRFSTSGEVELDIKCNAPNEHGDNELWHQQSKGEAMLYDYGQKGWFSLNTTDNKRWTTWLAHGDKPLPKYVQMVQLMGAL